MFAYVLIFLIPMLVTIPITALVCRFWASRGGRLSGSTVLASAMIAPLIAALAATCVTPDAWTTRNKGPGQVIMLVLLSLMTVTGFLPAGLIVRRYERTLRKSRNEAASS